MHIVLNIDKLEIHTHLDDAKLDEVLTLTRKIFKQGEKMAISVAELKADLAEANATTNEIADDVTALLAKIVEGGLTPAETQEVKDEITALNARLKGVAAQYPVATTPPDPGI